MTRLLRLARDVVRAAARRTGRRTSRWARTAAQALSTVLGAPDYARYVTHMQRAHPGQPTLTHEEFYRQQAARRYERPGSRCC